MLAAVGFLFDVLSLLLQLIILFHKLSILRFLLLLLHLHSPLNLLLLPPYPLILLPLPLLLLHLPLLLRPLFFHNLLLQIIVKLLLNLVLFDFLVGCVCPYIEPDTSRGHDPLPVSAHRAGPHLILGWLEVDVLVELGH